MILRLLRRSLRDRIKDSNEASQADRNLAWAEEQLQIQRAKAAAEAPVRERLERAYRRNHIAGRLARELREGGR